MAALTNAPGWSYPRSKSGETRSYSCRRLLFWHRGCRGGPMLGLQALDCYQTATLEGSPGSYADPEREDDHRCKICRVFHLLSTCAAAVHCTLLRYSCKSSSPTAPSSAVSQSGLAGRPRLPLPHRSDWEHRTAILGSITRSALAILALGRSQK